MPNVAPQVDLNGAAAGNDTTLTYAEGGPLVAIAPSATASDADSTDLDQGSLTVAFTAGGTNDDQLRIVGGDFLVDEVDLYYQGLLIGSITGGSDGSSPLIVTFNADATPAIAQALIRAIGYVNFSGSPVPGDRTITFTLADGDGGTSTPRIATVTVSSADTPPTAQNDSIATPEDAVVAGSLFLDNGHGEDIDPDGPDLTISAVNGSAANVGTTIMLASGAKLTVNADGTYSYDPNGRFVRLTDDSSGAVNTSATDSFTYTLAGGNTATVTVSVQGVAGPGDWLMGDGGNNLITGTANGDFFFDVSGGGDDFSGLGGNDVFFFGPSMTAADTVDGGTGLDQLVLQGDYSGNNALTLYAGAINLESIAILSGTDTRFGDPGTHLYDYVITTQDPNVAAGVQMIVDANRLTAGEDLTFNGSAETDGSFFIYGGGGVDMLTGGAKNDVFLFGAQGQWGSSDVVNGGSGIDQLALRGNYTITFGAGQLISIESIALVSAHDTRFGALGSSYSYNLTMNDGNVAAGAQLIFDAAQLRVAETLTFDASAEIDGSYRIFGGKNGDTITTGAGADFIQGGLGGDTLTGGGGADTFRYIDVSDSTGAAKDQILDFTPDSDKIDLGRIDANASVAGDQAFAWIGSNAFSNTAGELRATLSNGVWTVEGDTNGDGVADLVIAVTTPGAVPLGAADFLL